MKFKTTKKAMREGYYHIIGTGYCNLQHLLHYENEIAYSTRAEGWACDYYEVDGVLVSTGYAPLKSENVKCDYDMIREYNDKAEKVVYDYSMTWEEQKAEVRELLKKFVSEATQGF